MFRNTLLKLALSLGVFVGLLGTIELACRLTEPARAAVDDRFPPLPPKQDGELRVFVYGESTVWGHPIPAVGFVAQLQYWLTKLYPGRKVNVVNYGVASVSSATIDALVSKTVTQGPDAVVLMMGHNEFLKPASPPRAVRALHERSALFRRLTATLGQADSWPKALVPIARGPAFDARIAAFRANEARTVARITRRGTPLVLATVPANLSDWPPCYRRLVRPQAGGAKAYEAVIDSIQARLAEGKIDEAEREIERGSGTYPEDAMLAYLLGRARLASGDAAGARPLFEKARELDPFPWRVLPAENAATREIAAATGAKLVDVERILDAQSPAEGPGFNLFLDNCHPTPAANGILAASFAKALIGLLPAGADPGRAADCGDSGVFLRDSGYAGPEYHAKLFVINATYVMRTPFFNYGATRRFLDQAAALDPSRWDIWANYATVSLIEGHTDQGKAELQKARALKGSVIDLEDRHDIPNLKEALQIAGIPSW